MFEMAHDHARLSTNFEVVGGYLSPVNDAYKKSGLAPANHRIAMCHLACRRSNDWAMLDTWEATRDTYTRTASVLDHFNAEINVKRGGVDVVVCEGGERRTEKRRVKIVLLAGFDLIQTMSEPSYPTHDNLTDPAHTVRSLDSLTIATESVNKALK
jgi:nicotinamide mononucleotide adenylyltransferase